MISKFGWPSLKVKQVKKVSEYRELDKKVASLREYLLTSSGKSAREKDGSIRERPASSEERPQRPGGQTGRHAIPEGEGQSNGRTSAYLTILI